MRKFAFQAAAVLALVSSSQIMAAQTQAAEAGAKQCLTRPELRGMVAYFLPTVLQSTIDKCTQRLAADSYMLARAPQLVTTLEAGRAESWPMAKRAFIKIGGNDSKDTAKVFSSLPEEAIRPIVEAVISEKLGGAIKPENCGDINRIMTPLEPLPAGNMIDMVTEVMFVAARKDKSMPTCAEA
jgi:hypothetical protein